MQDSGWSSKATQAVAPEARPHSELCPGDPSKGVPLPLQHTLRHRRTGAGVEERAVHHLQDQVHPSCVRPGSSAAAICPQGLPRLA